MRALVVIFVLAAAPAQAFCSQLKALVDGAATINLPAPFNSEAKCKTALALSGETSIHCAWPFAFRSIQATDVFEALLKEVPTCLETSKLPTDDLNVNHPDYYDLKTFTTESLEVGVSLKDKGGLQQTYVFLRVAKK